MPTQYKYFKKVDALGDIIWLAKAKEAPDLGAIEISRAEYKALSRAFGEIDPLDLTAD